MTEMERSAWKTPELIVLERSRPEEAVLEGCKFSTELGSERIDFRICTILVDEVGKCVACYCIGDTIS